MPVIIGGTGVGLSTAPVEVTLAGAQAFLIPSGQYLADVGRYTVVQFLDPVTGQWRTRQPRAGNVPLTSDGTNVRLCNFTGCAAGAIITAKGSAYTNGIGTLALSPSAGGSVWQSIVGGAFNATVTTTTAGAYNYPPTFLFPPPPTGGLRATATCTLSAGGIGTVTFANRGAGWVGTVPTSVAINNTSTASASYFVDPKSPYIQIIQDPRDTAAGGGVITVNATLADSGALTGIVLLDPGTAAVTSLPTLTAASGSATAVVIMNWTATGMTVGAGGATYGAANPFVVTGAGITNQSTDFSGDLNPQNNIGILHPRNFWFSGVSTGGGAVTATGLVIDDAGFGLQAVPTGVVIPGNGANVAIPGTGAQVTITVGATNDTSWLQPFKL